MQFIGPIDPKKVIITFGGFPVSGFAEGTYIDLGYNVDAFEDETGCAGEGARLKTNDRTGLCTITLLQTAPSNDIFSLFHLLDREGGKGVQPFSMVDLLGRTAAFSPMGYIKKIASPKYSKSIEVREWRIFLRDLDLFCGGNGL
jgi:hypothetical protein